MLIIRFLILITVSSISLAFPRSRSLEAFYDQSYDNKKAEIINRMSASIWGDLIGYESSNSEQLSTRNKIRLHLEKIAIDRKDTVFLADLKLFEIDNIFLDETSDSNKRILDLLEENRENYLARTRTRPFYYFFKAYYEYSLFRYEEAIKIFEDVYKESHGNSLLVYRTNYFHAESLRSVGRFKEAKAMALEMIEYINSNNLNELRSRCYYLLGRIYRGQKEYAEAMNYIFKALDLQKKTGNYSDVVMSLEAISLIKYNMGKVDEELEYYLEAEKYLDKKSVSYKDAVRLYQNMAEAYSEKKEFDTAMKAITKSIELAKLNQDYDLLVLSKLSQANIKIRVSKKSEILEAIKILESLKDIEKKGVRKKSIVWRSWYMAKALTYLEEYDRAEPFIQQAINLGEQYDSLNIGPIYRLAILFYTKKNDYKNVYKYYKQNAERELKRAQEEKSKLLYARENEYKSQQNKLLKNQNKLNELQAKNLLTEVMNQRLIIMIALLLLMAVFLILALQFNRNRVIKAKNMELKRKEEIVREKTADLQVILDSIHQGVVTIELMDSNKQVIKNTSQYFFEIFEHLNQEDLFENGTLISLFEGTSLTAEDLSKIKSVVLASTHESLWQWEANEGSLPREMTLANPEKIIEIDWSVALENDVIQKVIVTFKDVTELRKLDDKQKKNEISTKKLITLALMDQREYSLFMNSIKKMMEESFEVIDSHKEYLREALDLAFRNLHTIKGLARSFDMILLSSFTHDVESLFHETRDKSRAYDRTLLLDQLKSLENEIETYRYLAKTKLNWDSEVSSVTLPIGELTSWYQKIALLSEEFTADDKFKSLLKDIKKRYSSTLNDALKNILNSSQKLSKELGKGEIQFKMEGCEIFIDQAYQDTVGSIFMHLIRNSIDHGFVEIEQRQELALPPPEIRITILQESSGYQALYQDTGRGLNLTAIKQRAAEKGLNFNSGSLGVAQAIFASGFSTKHEVSDISGRGVGMDAVRNYLVKNGGDIKLAALSEEREGFLPVSIQLSLPAVFFDA